MTRTAFLLTRLATLPAMGLAISFITFAMVHLAPGDVAALMAGPRASNEQIEALRAELGLRDPLLVQYGHYLGRFVTGDWGTTISGAPVTAVVGRNAPPTLLLVTATLVLTLVTTLVLSLLASRRPGGLVDHLIRLLSTTLLGMPGFWIGIMLLLFVALPTGWFPVGGYPRDFPGQVRAVILPSVALSVTVTPVLIRGLRASLIAVGHSDYVTVGRTLGLHGAGLMRRYVLRNAVIPTVPLVATMLGTLIGSTAVVEATFGLPGLGQALVNGAIQREASLVQAITLIVGLSVISTQIVADLLLTALDPRVLIR
jgi:peptide/nickel transport system permease protein